MNTEQRDTKFFAVTDEDGHGLTTDQAKAFIRGELDWPASHLNQPETTAADPKHIPTSFSEWLEQNGDSIDIGGNWIPDRIQANEDRYP